MSSTWIHEKRCAQQQEWVTTPPVHHNTSLLKNLEETYELEAKLTLFPNHQHPSHGCYLQENMFAHRKFEIFDGVNITHAEAIWILGTFRTSIIVNN